MTYSPWAALAALPTITVGYHELDGRVGIYFDDLKTIVLQLPALQLQVERRCTLAHELAHHHLGHTFCADRRTALRQEVEANVIAARWLIPIETYISIRLWTRCEVEMAQELWVDLPTLWSFREALTRLERCQVEQRLYEAQGEWGAA